MHRSAVHERYVFSITSTDHGLLEILFSIILQNIMLFGKGCSSEWSFIGTNL